MEEYTSTHIRLEKQQYDRLRDEAHETRRSQSEIVREALKFYWKGGRKKVKLIKNISKKIYREIYNALRSQKFDSFDVYLDEETGDVRAVSSGATYPGTRVEKNITSVGDFVDGDIGDYTEEEFAEACLTAFGNIEMS